MQKEGERLLILDYGDLDASPPRLHGEYRASRSNHLTSMPRLPAYTFVAVIRALGCAGFFLTTAPARVVFHRHPDRAGLVTVPLHCKDLKRGTIKSILYQAGLSTEEFLKLL
jgi:predicted RNA binding protein YcfA (HicA-like mRNA interferase family)